MGQNHSDVQAWERQKIEKKTWIVCFVGALGGFRVLPDTFFVDFGADFALCFRTAGDPQHMHNIAKPILKTHLQSSEQHIRRNTF